MKQVIGFLFMILLGTVVSYYLAFVLSWFVVWFITPTFGVTYSTLQIFGVLQVLYLTVLPWTVARSKILLVQGEIIKDPKTEGQEWSDHLLVAIYRFTMMFLLTNISFLSGFILYTLFF